MRLVDSVVDYLAWKNKKFVTSVNVESAINELDIPNRIKSQRKIYVIPDTYINEKGISIQNEKNDLEKKYDGMMGGYANRDFSLFFELAKKNKDLKFACIVGSLFKKNKYDIPNNVDLFRDVSECEFVNIMKMSRIVLIPLIDESVAGLVVLKQAILYKIPFVVSDTPAVINYVPIELRKIVLADLGNIDDFDYKFKKVYNASFKWDENARLIDDYASRWNPKNKISLIINILFKEKFI